jgi:hypothetical protein
MLDRPANCPFCGVRFINGGIPPQTNHPFVPPFQQPGFQQPVESVTNIAGDSSSSKTSANWTIPVVILVVVIGILVFAGGAWLMVVSFKDTRPARIRPRRPSRYEYD